MDFPWKSTQWAMSNASHKTSGIFQQVPTLQNGREVIIITYISPPKLIKTANANAQQVTVIYQQSSIATSNSHLSNKNVLSSFLKEFLLREGSFRKITTMWLGCSSIKTTDISPMQYINHFNFSSMYLEKINKVELLALMDNINLHKSPGSVNIGPKLVTDLKNILVNPMLFIFNLSLRGTDLYKKFNSLQIPQLRDYNILFLVHRFVFDSKHLPEIYHHYFTFNAEIHTHNTRQKDSLHTASWHSQLGKRNIKILGSNL